MRMRLGAAVLATTALASGLALATPAFADNAAPITVSAVKPHDGGCGAYHYGGGFKISACVVYQKKGKYKGKVLSYLDVRGVPSKKNQKKCQILGQTFKPGRPISKLKHFSCTKGNKIISATKPAKGLTLHSTGYGINGNRVKAEATSPQIWFS
jgi:hypothetical protein